jgi:cephalosporin-C deacetylase-like acetyl esterase
MGSQIKVHVVPTRADWTYKPGEEITFQITVMKNGHPVRGVDVDCKAGKEMMPPSVDMKLKLLANYIELNAGTLDEPGFLRCIATVKIDGKTYRGVGTAGIDPLSIKSVTEDPPDFDKFWADGKSALAKFPMDAKLTLMPELCTANVIVHHVNLQNFGTENTPSRLYGILCEPRAEGKYPAVLVVPGAGVRPYRGQLDLAEKGIITLQIGIHGIPVNLDNSLYDSLRAGALSNYWVFNLDNKNSYYYRRVYLGCVRANDFLTAHPKFDGKSLAVMGGSQGGALSIITAALDNRVKALISYYPALSDLIGYTKHRAGGWPHMFLSETDHRSPEKIETSKYYDVVNFARRVNVPGFYSWGYNDETCPPTSLYSAFNVIPGNKSLFLAHETGHWTYPEQIERGYRWLDTYFKTGKPE